MTFQQWLSRHGLDAHASMFAENHIDLRVAPKLSEADLKELGLSLGHRKIFLEAVESLRAPSPDLAEGAASPNAMASQPERRQLTILFCDLVGSTQLSQQLDPEALREIMQSYQKTCAGVVATYDGHIAQFLGDGIMVYFGWPRAHEDDAERAIRTALEMVTGVKAVVAPSSLRVRIGIATGPVVVGETGEGDASIPKMAVGETPNIAARLQTLAGADEIVIGASTYGISGGHFRTDDLGTHVLKGILQPVQAYRVLDVVVSEGRFEAAHRMRPATPLIGREEEMAILRRRWELARQGQGQVVLVQGEAGIGKSRLIRALQEHVGEYSFQRWAYQCSPFQLHNTMYPVIGQLQRTASIERTDSAAMKLDKIEKLLSCPKEMGEETHALIAQLLSLPADRYPAIAFPPQKQKEKTLLALLDHIERVARRSALLLVLEDAHWIDPTTREMFDLLLARAITLPVLVLISFRPDFSHHWGGPSHVSQLQLARLSVQEGTALIDKVTSGKALPSEVLTQILQRTDGVPLFVEELTKTVLESKYVRDVGTNYELTGPLPALAIPSTLHDSLMARLDRWPQAKALAQLGACIGREFGHELLMSVIGGDEMPWVVQALQLLDQAELVVRRGVPPNAVYIFKHALIQDAAYASLLSTTRRATHRRIAEAMTQQYVDQADAQPEFVAHQYAEAGLDHEAIAWWLKAGKRAFQRAAIREAVASYEKGLEVVARMPASQERDRAALGLSVGLVYALMLYRGWGAPETGEAVARTAELARALFEAGEASTDLYWALRAPGTYYMTTGQQRRADVIADQSLTAAQRSGDIDARMDSHNLRAMTSFAMGDVTTAREHTAQGFNLYGTGRRSHPLLIGQDTKIRLSWWRSWSLYWLGFPEQALACARECLLHGTGSTHVFEQCWSNMILGQLCVFMRAPDLDEGAMAHAFRLAAEHEFGHFKPLLPCYYGGMLTLQGRAAEALPLFDEYRPALRRAGSLFHYGVALYFLADTHQALGQYDEGLEVIDEAMHLAGKNFDTWNVPNLHRLRGEMFLARDGAAVFAVAETEFRRAIDLARDMKARSLELRATTALANLLDARGERSEARVLLDSVYRQFTEGHALTDLKEASALLDILNSSIARK